MKPTQSEEGSKNVSYIMSCHVLLCGEAATTQKGFCTLTLHAQNDSFSSEKMNRGEARQGI